MNRTQLIDSLSDRLCRAINRRDTKDVERLLQNEFVDVTVYNDDPMRLCVQYGSYDIVQLLFKHPKIDPVKYAQNFITSAVSYCTTSDHCKIVHLFLQYNIAISIRTISHATPSAAAILIDDSRYGYHTENSFLFDMYQRHIVKLFLVREQNIRATITAALSMIPQSKDLYNILYTLLIHSTPLF